MVATINPGDEVVIPAPFWVSYPEMVLLCDGTPVRAVPAEQRLPVAARGSRRGDYAQDQMADPELAVEPDRAAYSEADLRVVADVLLRHPHVWVMTDDMYEHLVYDDFEYRTIAQVEPRLYERTLTVNGVSKAYCMTGWRIGFGGGPKALIKAMGAIQSNSTANPCSISQAAAVEALNGPKDFIPVHNKSFMERRDLVVDLLNRIPGLFCPRPEGAFTSIPPAPGSSASAPPPARRSPTTRISCAICWRRPGSRWCMARLSGCRRISASPTRRRARCCGRPVRVSTAPAAHCRRDTDLAVCSARSATKIRELAATQLSILRRDLR